MAKTDQQVILRVTADLKEKLHKSAQENHRSLNGELINRLEKSFAEENDRQKLDELLSWTRQFSVNFPK